MCAHTQGDVLHKRQAWFPLLETEEEGKSEHLVTWLFVSVSKHPPPQHPPRPQSVRHTHVQSHSHTDMLYKTCMWEKCIFYTCKPVHMYALHLLGHVRIRVVTPERCVLIGPQLATLSSLRPLAVKVSNKTLCSRRQESCVRYISGMVQIKCTL